jgi:hypothetical protein
MEKLSLDFVTPLQMIIDVDMVQMDDAIIPFKIL